MLWNCRSISGTGEKRGRKPADKGKQAKRKKNASWTPEFICLSKRNQESVPDSEERMMLQLSGLGERKITFCLDADNQEIYDEILSTFSKLSGGGGFEMLRVSEGGG